MLTLSAAVPLAVACVCLVLMLVAGVASMACFFGGSVGACTVAIYPLQVSLFLAGLLQKGFSAFTCDTHTQRQKQGNTPAPRHSLTRSLTQSLSCGCACCACCVWCCTPADSAHCWWPLWRHVHCALPFGPPVAGCLPAAEAATGSQQQHALVEGAASLAGCVCRCASGPADAAAAAHRPLE